MDASCRTRLSQFTFPIESVTLVLRERIVIETVVALPIPVYELDVRHVGRITTPGLSQFHYTSISTISLPKTFNMSDKEAIVWSNTYL